MELNFADTEAYKHDKSRLPYEYQICLPVEQKRSFRELEELYKNRNKKYNPYKSKVKTKNG